MYVTSHLEWPFYTLSVCRVCGTLPDYLINIFSYQKIVQSYFNIEETQLLCHLRYLLTNNTHDIPNFIHCLAVPIILFPLTCVEEEKIFNELKIVKAKLFTQMSQDQRNSS